MKAKYIYKIEESRTFKQPTVYRVTCTQIVRLFGFKIGTKYEGYVDVDNKCSFNPQGLFQTMNRDEAIELIEWCKIDDQLNNK